MVPSLGCSKIKHAPRRAGEEGCGARSAANPGMEGIIREAFWRIQSHEIWRNQTNPWMKGITSGCREEAVCISRVAAIPLSGRSKTSPGLPQVRPAGRGHARFCNLLIIKYHFYCSVETMAFFGCVSTPRFITH